MVLVEVDEEGARLEGDIDFVQGGTFTDEHDAHFIFRCTPLVLL